MHAGEKAGSTVHMHVILRVLCVTYSVRSGREIMPPWGSKVLNHCLVRNPAKPTNL